MLQRAPTAPRPATGLLVLLLAFVASPLAGQDRFDPATYDAYLPTPGFEQLGSGPGEQVSFLDDCSAGCDEANCPNEPIDCCGDGCCGDGDCGCGDGVGGCGGAGTPNPCAQSHKVLFYANDFSYLNDPSYNGHCLGDCLKLMPIAGGDWGTLDIGGQLRLRYHHEDGMGRQLGQVGFGETTNDFMLTRLRLYQNWKVNNWLRIYSEGIFADVLSNGAYLPRAIDRNSADFLNLFVDLKLVENASLRVGRQELLFGDQRLVSPLDWANTRRTFEGFRGTVKIGKWTVDPFYANFVPVKPNDFDEADYDRSFYGFYATCGGKESSVLDVYYLGFDHQTAGTPIVTDFSLHTVGGRFKGKFADQPLLFDLEGAYQGGRQSGLGVDHAAAFCTCGLGHKFSGLRWAPALWIYWDYASGNVPGGAFNRFNQLFPLAHKYLGFIDAAARSNISSPNCLLTFGPNQKLQFLVWYYYLGANQAEDVVPPVGFQNNQNLVSKNLGNELDLIARYRIAPRSNVLIGYSNLWRGSKILGTNDAEFLYGQWELNF